MLPRPLVVLAFVLSLLLAGCVQVAPSAEREEDAVPTPAAVATPRPNETMRVWSEPPLLARLPQPLAADPVAPGPYTTVRREYDFGPAPHLYTERLSAYPLHLRGALHAPKDGEGPFPVVLFEHGRHTTCRLVTGHERHGTAGQCPRAPPVVEPVDSYAGYDWLASALASHGYVILSVDANAVNDLDATWGLAGTNRDAGAEARADVLLRTLDKLRELNANPGDPTWGSLLAGRLDMQRVGLMGHSRGGEGVTHAIHANLARPEAERHALGAVFALAPIDATSTHAPGVAFATLLPYCDGDVQSLAGGRIFDASRRLEGETMPKTQILVMGANHNYYNTEWPYDDGGWHDDEACGADSPMRLTAEAQRLEGQAHMASFFRLHLGGETAWAPLFDGTATLPMASCPREDACAGMTHVSRVTPLDAWLEPKAAKGFVRDETCAPPDCKFDGRVVGTAERRVLAWNGTATLTLRPPDGPFDVQGHAAFAFRAAVDPTAPENRGLAAQDVRVLLVDAAGGIQDTRASLWSRALFTPPGDEAIRKLVLNDVRIPLEAFPRVDLARVVEIRLVFDATPQGVLHVADARFTV